MYMVKTMSWTRRAFLLFVMIAVVAEVLEARSKEEKTVVGPSFLNEELIGGVQGKQCSRGYWREDDVQCKPCPRGTYGDSNDLTSSSQCTKCPKGTFRDMVGGTSEADCLPCPSGTYGELTGVTTSQCSGYCAKGRYSLKEGLTTAASCDTCPAGYFNWQCRSNKSRQAKYYTLGQ